MISRVSVVVGFLLSVIALNVAFPLRAMAGGQVVAAESATTELPLMRVCADPDNLPFSKSEGSERGLYIDLAQLVAERLKVRLEYVWWLSFNQKRAVRNTLLTGECDAFFAIPSSPGFMGKRVAKTKSFLNIGYVMVSMPDVRIGGLSDLKDRRIAVQFSSTPQIFFAARGGFNTTTYKTDAEIFKALADHEVDVAFLSGPTAGFANRTKYANAYRITPIVGEDMGGAVAVGVRSDKAELLAKLNTALDELKPEVLKLAEKYAVPSGEPVNLGDDAAPQQVQPAPPSTEPAEEKKSQVAPAPAAEKPAAEAKAEQNAPAEVDPSKGHEYFNNHCAHCHAQDAMSPVQERDLRRLSRRYGKTWKENATQTISNGRPDDGMPTWGGVLSFEEIATIVRYLETVQN